jgi:GTP-binding protein
MFIDKATIYITAGRGGAGCISFRREKYVPLGGPDGGNGGRGGDVYLLADPRLTTLLDLTYRPHYEADSGGNGSPKNCSGRGAEDLIMKVPVGTVVYRNDEPFADLKENGQCVLVAKGGRGGRGNASFRSHRHTAPRIAEKGEPGESATLRLELLLIADVGLAGMPNAGKSTLLSRISAAHPKIADYPFTTLTPNLGVAHYKGRSFVVADIPGLIEGAHEGKGIGDEFLRHIQRTRVIIHLIDVNGVDGETAYQSYRTINRELVRYSKRLAGKPMIIAVNKMDLTDAKKRLAAFKRHVGKKKIFPLSCVTGEGIDALLSETIRLLAAPAEEEPLISPVKRYVYEPEFTVAKEDDVFVVRGKKVDTLAEMTEFGEEEALRRFQNILKKIGVEKALEDNGIKEGDMVRIGDWEFTYEK